MTGAGAMEISLLRLGAGYVVILMVLALAARWKTGRTGEILIATARMTVQLVAVGYLLELVFDRPHPLVTVALVMLMEVFAVANIFSRVSVRPSRALRRVIVVAMVSGTTMAVLLFLGGILALDPWYSPRYVIPIAGMLIGNSMTGISLGFERLVRGMEDNARKVEGALMLGATPAQAAHHIAREAFAAAILPTVNAMVGMGIVFLPGMMTGQILSGSSPVLAIRYQIAIMLGILGSVTLTVFLVAELGYRTFFTADQRLELSASPGSSSASSSSHRA